MGRFFAALVVTCSALVVAPPSTGAASSTFHAVTGKAYEAIACASSSRCVAVGPMSSVSTDNGNSWKAATQPITNGLPQSVTCPTSSVCVAAGTSRAATGAIWRTVDGGAHWTTVSVPAVSPLTTVTCPSSTRCVARGLVSTNSGQTWSAHQAPVVDVYCVRGASRCIGDDGNGNAYYSTNAGATWTHSTVPPGITTLSLPSCASTTVCFLIAGPLWNQGLLRSTNGGKTFTGSTSSDTAVYGVACENTTKCVLVGESLDLDYTYSESTTDAGATWNQDQPSPESQTQEIVHVACTTARCFAATETEPLSSTDNLGGSWTVRVTTSLHGSGVALACKDTTHCIQIDHYGTAYSTDGGSTWHPHLFGSGGFFNGVSCATALHCFLLEADHFGDPYVVGTTDGGATWNEPGPDGITAIACPTTTHCIGLDFGGQVDWTAAGGWATVTSSNTPNAGAFTCGASTRCYVTNFTTIAVTTDEGASWNPTTAPPFDVDSIACSDALHCIVATPSWWPSTLVGRTTDGGNSWNVIATPNIGPIASLSCNATGRCLATSQYGIIESTDSGATWARDTVNGGGGGTDSRCRGTACVVIGAVTLRAP